VQEWKHVDLIILFQYTRNPEHCSRRKHHELESVLLKLHLMKGEVLKLFKKVHTLSLHQLGEVIHLGWVIQVLIEALILKGQLPVHRH
jgi:galactokinase/mevalonate kinase-like predicted kinase